MAKEQAQKYIDDAKRLVTQASGLLDCAVQLGGTDKVDAETISNLEDMLDDVSEGLSADRINKVIDEKLIEYGIAANIDFRNDGRVCLDLTALSELCNLVEYGIRDYIGYREGTTYRDARSRTKTHTEESLRKQYLEEGRKYAT